MHLNIKVSEINMCKFSAFPKWLAAIVSSVLSVAASADDIELFASRPPSQSATPNVLFVLDNGANFSASVTTLRCAIDNSGNVYTGSTLPAGYTWTYLDKTASAVEQCAMYAAINALDAGGTSFNIGFMAFNNNGMKQFDPSVGEWSNSAALADVCPSQGGAAGGCLMMKMVPFNAITKPRILAWIRNWSTSASAGIKVSGNNSANGGVMQESWAFFNGREGISRRSYSGLAPTTAICGGGNNIIFVGNAYRNNNAPGDQTNATYSPLMRLIKDPQVPSAQWATSPDASAVEKATISRAIPNVCGTTFTTSSADEGRGGASLNWALYMRNRGIKTYSIGVLGPNCNAEYAAQLTVLGDATVGGGKYFSTNTFDELKLSIGSALSEIIASNSAFSSVSLPVSVNNQGTYINQVYIGMFRPAQDFFPRWPGNLKQYRMAMINNQLKLVDRRTPDTSAISSNNTGFIAECAESYWSPAPSTSDNYWATSFSAPNCSPYPAGSNSPDGPIVEKGAQGFMLRSAAPASRVLKTCGATCASQIDFNTSTTSVAVITAAKLGAADATERDAIIDWVRGANNKNDETFVSASATRPSVHGDVIHSRPVAVNFATGSTGTSSDPNLLANRKVVVFYGGNDGVLRAINGNRDGGLNIGGVAPGGEIWGFVAPESFSIFKRLRDNVTPIYFPGTTASSPTPKSYGFDGPIVSFSNASNAYVVASMRRGGRKMYTFNVSNLPTAGAVPSVLWSLGCGVNLPLPTTVTLPSQELCSAGPSGDTEGFTQMGQAWATPKVLNLPGYSAGPVLIFGGGYDPCEDTDDGTVNHSCTSSSKGNRIYVVDALTGALLKRFNTVRGVVGEIAIVPDSSGVPAYAYASDLGGNVYRIAISNSDPSAWPDSNLTRIASLGCDTLAPCSANRKFLFGPDVVDENGTHYVLVGSGDREKPVSAYTATRGVHNKFFMIKDKPSDPGWLTNPTASCSGQSIICAELLTRIDSGVAISQKGWYLDLADEEQVVTSAITIFGTVTFSTHKPYVAPSVITNADQCASLGDSNVYNIGYLDASPADGVSRSSPIVGDGLPPSPVAGKVTLDDGSTVPFLFGGSPSSPLESKKPTGSSSAALAQPKVRIYWYIKK
jgi:type IV pilus assembly protein PilY1